jgi:hypothetical protein
MAQNHNFGLKPRSRLEAVAQQADEKEGNCDHQPQLFAIRQPPPLRRIGFSEATPAGQPPMGLALPASSVIIPKTPILRRKVAIPGFAGYARP